MFKINIVVFFSFTILFSSNCSLIDNLKYYRLSNNEFHQGHKLNDERSALYGNKKKVAIYDEFITKAIFDVLYLSDSVRKAYVDKHAQKKGLDDSTKKKLILTELEHNKNWIKFYILSDIRDKEHQSLNSKNSMWSIYLRFNDKITVQPLTIKEVELSPEYQCFFGSRFTRFQRSYEVTFPAKNLNNVYYIRNKIPFKLVFNSPRKDTFLVFNKKNCVASKTKKDTTNKKTAFPNTDNTFINQKSMRMKHLRSTKRIVTKKLKTNAKKRKILNDEDFYWI